MKLPYTQALAEIFRHCLPVTEKVSEEFNELNLVCVRHNGAFISQESISDMCLTFCKKIEGMGAFHFSARVISCECDCSPLLEAIDLTPYLRIQVLFS